MEPSLRKDLVVIWRDSGARHVPAPGFIHHLLDEPAGVAWARTCLNPRTAQTTKFA